MFVGLKLTILLLQSLEPLGLWICVSRAGPERSSLLGSSVSVSHHHRDAWKSEMVGRALGTAHCRLLRRHLDIRKASQEMNSAWKLWVPRQLVRQGTLHLPGSVGPQMFLSSCYLGACVKPCSQALCGHVTISPCLL